MKRRLDRTDVVVGIVSLTVGVAIGLCTGLVWMTLEEIFLAFRYDRPSRTAVSYIPPVESKATSLQTAEAAEFVDEA